MPIDYQYYQSVAIYHLFKKHDEFFSKWLHDNGYVLNSGKKFKMFCYSPFKIMNRKVVGDRINIYSDVEWRISFYGENETMQFVHAVWGNGADIIEIADKTSNVQFLVKGVQLLPEPNFKDEMRYRLMSSMFVRTLGNEHLSPKDRRAPDIVASSLREKYLAATGLRYDGEIGVEFVGEPRSKLISIKKGTDAETKIRAYSGVSLVLKASPQIQRIAYDTGIGNLTSLGFGCLEIEKMK